MKFLFAKWRSDDAVEEIRCGLYAASALDDHVKRFFSKVQDEILKGAGGLWFGALEQVKDWDPEKKEARGVYAMFEEIHPIVGFPMFHSTLS